MCVTTAISVHKKRSSSVVVEDLSWEVSFGGNILQMFVLDNGRMLQVVTADTGFLLLNGDCVAHRSKQYRHLEVLLEAATTTLYAVDVQCNITVMLTHRTG